MTRKSPQEFARLGGKIPEIVIKFFDENNELVAVEGHVKVWLKHINDQVECGYIDDDDEDKTLIKEPVYPVTQCHISLLCNNCLSGLDDGR